MASTYSKTTEGRSTPSSKASLSLKTALASEIALAPEHGGVPENGGAASQGESPSPDGSTLDDSTGLPTTETGLPTTETGLPTTKNGLPTTKNGLPTTGNGRCNPGAPLTQAPSTESAGTESSAVQASKSTGLSVLNQRRTRLGQPRAASELGSGGRLATLTGVQVVGTGSFVPEEVVRNEDLAVLGYDADWILQRTGIRERRRAAANVATSDVACEAARRCLEQAEVAAEDVDLVIVATMTPDMPSPSTACFVQQGLGVTAPAMDVSAACAGFMYALITGMQFVHSGCHRRVLVVGADLMTRIVDPADKKTFPLFGDGAGAVLLAPGSRSQGLLSYCLGADGRGADLLCTPAGGSREPASPQSVEAGKHYLQMEGRSVFKWAVRILSESVSEVLQQSGLGIDDVDLTVWHQANLRILDAASSNLGLPREKVLVNVDRFGNTSAGSIPLCLDEASRDGTLKRGDRVLLSGFGAGLAWGTGIFQW